MERESNPMQPMCRSGCGFYGNPSQDGLCSICFKDALRKKQQPPVSSTPVSASSPVNSSTQTINSSTDVRAQSTPTHVDHNTAQPTVLLHNNQSSADKEVEHRTKSPVSNMLKRPSNESLGSDKDEKKKRLSKETDGKVNKQEEGKKKSASQEPSTSKRLSSHSSPHAVSKKSLPDESADDAGPSNQDDDKDGDKDAKKKKNRCVACKRKVGLTGFECRCGGLFCAIHRYSDKHECTFDYREHGAAEIRRNNPVVVGEKIQKI